jgi:hypothetical protein
MGKIKELKVKIGGYGGSYLDISSDGTSIHFIDIPWEDGELKEEISVNETITSSALKWDEFHDAIARLNPLRWAAKYEPQRIVHDGTWWEFFIVADEWILKSEGYNACPYDGNPEPDEPYIAFLEAIEGLTGKSLED